jgi:hypothetical protein
MMVIFPGSRRTATEPRLPKRKLWGVAILSWAVFISVFFLALPSSIAYAGNLSWSGVTSTPQRIKDVTIRVSPKTKKVYIIGHHERGEVVDGGQNCANDICSGIFMYTSDSNFQTPIRIVSPPNDKIEKVRSTFDLDGNLYIVWHERPGDFVGYMRKMDANGNWGSIINLNSFITGGNRQLYHLDIQAPILPGTNKNLLYITAQEKVAGGGQLGVGVYESADGGNTWTYYQPPLEGVSDEATGGVPRIAVGLNGEVHVGFSRSVKGMFVASKVPSKANQDGHNAQGWKVFTMEGSGGSIVYYRSMSAHPNGRVYAVWASFTGLGAGAPALAVWDPAAKAWGPSRYNVTNENSGNYARIYDVNVSSGANNQVVLNYAVDIDPPGGQACGDFFTYYSRLRHSASDDQGQNWNTPIFVNSIEEDLCPPKRMDTYFDGNNKFHFAGEYDQKIRYVNATGGDVYNYFVAPATNVKPLAATIDDLNGEFEIELGCTTGCSQGAPVVYDVYHRDVTAGGAWAKYLRTTSSVITFHAGVPGHVHQFYTRGTVGDKTEAAPAGEAPDAQTQVNASSTGNAFGDISYFQIATTPTRIFDTRTGSGLPGAGQPLPLGGTLEVAVVGGISPVPQGSVAVIANITVSETTGPGFVVAYPANKPNPGTSSVNWSRPNAQIGNMVIVPLSTDGKIKVSSSASAGTNFTVDILGYTDKTIQSALYYRGLSAPVRTIQNDANATMLPGTKKDLKIAGEFGIPVGAKAVFANVTAGQTTDGGNAVIYPRGIATPATTTVNYQRAQTGALSIANFSLIKLSDDGFVTIETRGTGKVNLLVDIVGYLDSDRTGGVLDVFTPQRIYDSRPPEFGGNAAGKLTVSNSTTSRTLNEAFSATESNATAVLFNVTATDISKGGYVALYPGGTNYPGNSTVSYSVDRSGAIIKTFANFALSGVDSEKRVNVIAGNAGSEPVNLILDISGFILPNPFPTN